MKLAIVLIALALFITGLYLHYRPRPVGSGEAKQGAPERVSAPSAPAPPERVAPAPAQAQTLLADARFIRALPDSWSGAARSDRPAMVLEAMDEPGFPPQIALAPNVWFELAPLDFLVTPGAKFFVTMKAVHTSSANPSEPRHKVQVAPELLPPSVEDLLQNGEWRKPPPIFEASARRPPIPHLWATAFEERIVRGDLRGEIHVEGTFEKRSEGSTTHHAFTLEECPNVQFHVPKGSTWEKDLREAESAHTLGDAVTIRMTIDLDASPKYSALTFAWGLPLQERLDYWEKQLGAKRTLLYTLALATWAEARGMNKAATTFFAQARKQVTAENIAYMGITRKGVRVHLIDEIQDHWFFESCFPVHEPDYRLTWKGRGVTEEFLAQPTGIGVVLTTNSSGVSRGDYYIVRP